LLPPASGVCKVAESWYVALNYERFDCVWY